MCSKCIRRKKNGHGTEKKIANETFASEYSKKKKMKLNYMNLLLQFYRQA